MTWKIILKQIRRVDRKGEEISQTRMAGGSKADDLLEVDERNLDVDETFEDVYDSKTDDELARATKQDIITEIEYYLKGLSKEKLIDILVRTKGDIRLKDDPFE
jgi:hypothetical protein|tara:strand:+ start:540 stop:851 length:312 start_codon:yes stop_codon:yes gene_type:complete